MQTLAEIKSLLDARGMRPKRSLGQNFLIDHNLIRKLVDASGVGAGDLVLEIGPGTGTMTEELLARGCRVVAGELDDGLADLLRERFEIPTNEGRFVLVHRDCLEGKHAVAPELIDALRRTPGPGSPLPSPKSPVPSFSLVANLPYGAATPLISTLLIDHPQCHTFAVTVQRELADRLVAKPGSKDYGPISILVEIFAHAEKIAKAPPECFWPRPEVTSSLVLMRRLADPITHDGRGLSAFLHDLFAHRRKQIGGVLGPSVNWSQVAKTPGCESILPTMRAEEIAAPAIVAMGRALQRISA